MNELLFLAAMVQVQPIPLDILTPGFLTLMAKNWHTTLAGVLGAALNYFVGVGFQLPENRTEAGVAVTSIVIAALGALAKSQNVSSIPQTNNAAPVTLPTAEALTATVGNAVNAVAAGSGAEPLRTPSA